ncbi:hypothetical protein SAMD00019534_032230 [Acytostelium subglobosum LB1]|uniref:hypothetical protein n=1 Tax=Acytostelium subglobosum LB1 TaxID=1410327 RepID=UPI000644E90B|nr:hypothetical protein SAMD00019534_032230 [Acytostelium subglobosum LB1]GAM20048.1 hypothetical protein SAMD00019534_032230 [Acytostelium subglobosum LB1]|eukprot:XP_012756810.1 hypothetical protein SAMD00019534_032230 [Acytostelium subglobosum LB1]
MPDLDNCQFSNGTHHYDFSGLYNTTQYSRASGRNTYYFNICAPSQLCQMKAGNSDSVVCQQSGSTFYNLGLSKTGQWSALSNGKEGAQVHYSDGAPCSRAIRNTVIQLECGTGPTTILSVSEVEACSYEITMSSSLACPQ